LRYINDIPAFSGNLTFAATSTFGSNEDGAMHCKIKSLFAVLFSLGFVQAASAADMPARAPIANVPMVLPYNWTGFYVGGDLGGGWGDHDRSVVPPGFQNSYRSNGVIGGIHGGYNYQIQSFVIGAETDINWTSIKGDDGGAGGTLDQTKLNWIGSLRGRLGYAWDRFLVFGTGGLAYGELEHYNNAAPGQTFRSTRTGWTAGGGLEYAVDANWLVRAEYRYYDLGTYQFSTGPCRTCSA
jgi:outer membrane immunogenic protein